MKRIMKKKKKRKKLFKDKRCRKQIWYFILYSKFKNNQAEHPPVRNNKWKTSIFF